LRLLSNIKEIKYMNRILKISAIAALLVVFATSCELDKFPYSGIEQSQSFITMDDAVNHRNGLYNTLRARSYGAYTYATDIQSDWLNATLDFGNRFGFPHRWTEFLASDYTIRDTWAGYYAALSNVNNIITRLPDIPTKNSTEETNLNTYLGEAYFLRAYYYHQLILRFAKDYEPATASSDPGVPLVLEYNINLLPSRSTIAEVYQQIIDDLTIAKEKLAGVVGAQSSSRLTIDCVTALEARVYLCMHNWSSALISANSLIGNPTYTMISNPATFKSMWKNDVSSEVIFQLFASIDEGPNANGVYLGYSFANKVYTPDWLPTQEIVDFYDDTDIRKDAYFMRDSLRISGTDYSKIWLFNKYPGNPVLYSGNQTNYRQKPKIFRLAEMYLISAEAAAQTPATEADALTTLNALRVIRGLPALAGLTGSALMDAIKAERRRELLGEGHRLDDLKRWKMGFTRGTPQGLNFIQQGADYQLKIVEPNADKFVWAIPTRDVTVNPNLANAQNPGW
jgi:starch-binding outer membrane protein, SusD/RagB family